MNRRFSLALLAVSVTILMWGFRAGNPLNLEILSLVPGTPASHGLSLVILGAGGIMMSCIGLWPQQRG